MRITLLAAIDNARGIARAGIIPWDLPADRKRFKERTMGKVVLWGRKTHDSLGGRRLPGRVVLVLSRNEAYRPPNPSEYRVESWKQALVATTAIYSAMGELAAAGDERELLVAGGQDLYELALPYAQRVELTEAEGTFGCDRFFPELDRKVWRLQGMAEPFVSGEQTGRYVTYVRREPG